MKNMAYAVSEEDIENVLSSNAMTALYENTAPIDKMAAVLIGQLDLDKVEAAALCGDDLDEQTDLANDEIAAQLRSIGVLKFN